MPAFGSLEEEVRYLRGLLAVHEMADAILEDCLERKLGLAAALDVFLAQCGRMVHATGAFVELRGTREPVLRRVWGRELVDVARLSAQLGVSRLDAHRFAFVARLDLGATSMGALGFVIPGSFDDGGEAVQSLVKAVAEMLDSALLAFLALADGLSPLERLDELSEQAAFRPRGRVGKYELVAPLGAGGMAQVMLARASGPEGIGRLVALKCMLPHLAGDPTVVDQFLDEARIGLKLSHPNLVTFYDFGQAAQGYFLTMELLRGADLSRTLRGAVRLEAPLAVAVVGQALRGLHAAHELLGEDGQPLGLVHRDLSPNNLMVCFDGRTKVLDFGVAKARAQRTVTVAGIVKGKPLYMSPEQATDQPIDRRSDLFAAGLVLFEALTGARPFQRDTDEESMDAIVGAPLERPGAIPRRLWSVLESALDKQPDHRPATALELAQALEEAVTPAEESEVATFLRRLFPERYRECLEWEQEAEAQRQPSSRRERSTSSS